MLKQLLGFGIVITGALFACLASAQDLAQPGGGRVELLNVLANERTADGQLDACELVYRVGYEDYAYRKGDLVIINGSASLFLNDPDKQPTIIVKMTAYDVIGNDLQLAPMNYGFISAGGTSYAHEEYAHFRCEDGGLCIGYTFADHIELAMALSDRFELSFNRQPGGTDVRIPIAIGRDRPEQEVKYATCVLKLIDILQARLQ